MKGVTILENTQRETILDKMYYVKGIEEIISKDEQGNPFFKLYNGVLKVLVKLKADREGEEAPAMSLTPAEFIGLVHAFGATDFLPDYSVRESTAVLLEGVQKANAAGQVLAVESKNGWANTYTVRAIHPPEGLYTVKLREVFSPQHPGTLEFSEGRNDSTFIILKFAIVADGQGNPTLWEGFDITIFLGNPFVNIHQNEATGEVLNAIDRGHPLMEHGKPSARWEAFGKYFAPGIWDTYEWAVEPSKSRWGVCEVTSPQYPIIHAALAAGVEVKVWYEKMERKDDYWFDLLAVRQHNPEPVVLKETTVQDFIDYVKSKTWTYTDAAGELVEIDEVFASEVPLEFVLNDDNKSEWALNFLGGDNGTWAAAGLPEDDHRIEALSSQQLEDLIAEMKVRFK